MILKQKVSVKIFFYANHCILKCVDKKGNDYLEHNCYLFIYLKACV